MNGPGVSTDGIIDERPDREATTGVVAGRERRRARQEVMVPPASFESYYGKPVINKPVWASPDIPGYLFLGGLAGASSVLAAGAQLTGRPSLGRVSKLGASAAGVLSLVALVHDLGRPKRFLNMLRVFKVTSPMSVGSWVLSAYVPAALASAASDVTGIAPGLGAAATCGAATLGPVVAAYTAALISNTAVPAWHDAHREMPFVFVASAASAAGGLGLVGATLSDNGPARRLGIVGGAAELVLTEVMEKSLHETVAESYHSGKAKKFMRAAEVLTAGGVLAALVGARRSRVVAGAAGAALVAGSACTRFAIFWAGEGSAIDAAATIAPQRERLDKRAQGHELNGHAR